MDIISPMDFQPIFLHGYLFPSSLFSPSFDLKAVDKIVNENYNKTMSEEQILEAEQLESAEPGNSDKNTQKIHLSHDGLFRTTFDKKEVAESFIRENLPAEIVKDLDFSALSISRDSFVDKKLARSYSDILYHARFRGNPAYVYFLFEHKSWEPDYPGIQLLRNMTHIWEGHLVQHKNTKKLPPIIPLLIYHGASPWEVDTNFVSMFDVPETLKKYIPSFDFELYDISHMPEEMIKGNVELRIILMAFRYIFHPEILSRLKPIFQLFREFSDKIKFDEYLGLLLVYLSSNLKDVKFDQLQGVVNEALEEGGVKMGTIMQELLNRGKEIGIKEGVEIGKKEGEEQAQLKVALNCIMKGMDSQTIAELTELDIEQIESLKAAIKSKTA
jgi:predicted transposase/invertase (TIGR01784 family)